MIRSMRTDMSVVSQSKMYEGASNFSLRMSNYLIRISIVFLLGIDFLYSLSPYFQWMISPREP